MVHILNERRKYPVNVCIIVERMYREKSIYQKRVQRTFTKFLRLITYMNDDETRAEQPLKRSEIYKGNLRGTCCRTRGQNIQIIDELAGSIIQHRVSLSRAWARGVPADPDNLIYRGESPRGYDDDAVYLQKPRWLFVFRRSFRFFKVEGGSASWKRERERWCDFGTRSI